MGDACGDSPCGFSDYAWAPSSDCCNYLQCSDPGSLLYLWSCPNSGTVGQQVGNMIGQQVGGLVKGTVSGAVNPNPTAGPDWTMIGILAVGGLIAVAMVMKK